MVRTSTHSGPRSAEVLSLIKVFLTSHSDSRCGGVAGVFCSSSPTFVVVHGGPERLSLRRPSLPPRPRGGLCIFSGCVFFPTLIIIWLQIIIWHQIRHLHI
jgi:hypothetical protein